MSAAETAEPTSEVDADAGDESSETGGEVNDNIGVGATTRAENAGVRTMAVLGAVRRTPRRRVAALIVAALAGLVLAWAHWLGLFAAGALVGLASRTLPRAIMAGVVFGVLVLAVQVLATPGMGVGGFFALSPPSYVAVAAALCLPAWGALIRGVV